MTTLTKLDLTDARALKAEVGEYQDAQTKALRLYVSPTGTRSYAIYKWSAAFGKPIKKVIGRCPEMTVAAARAEATALLRQIAEGKDLDRPDKELSLRELTKLYTADLRERRTKQPLWASLEVEKKLADWMPKPLSHITTGMIKTRAARITADRGPQAAARAIKAIRAIFNFAKQNKYYVGDNEAKDVEIVESEPRQRVMTNDERTRILAVLNSDDVPSWYQPYFRLLMITGVRRTNLATAKWCDIDLDAALWVIPAEESKSGRALEIALNEEAVTILRGRLGLHDTWVFSSRQGAALADPFKAWQRVLARAGVPKGLTLHDLRRTYGGVLINAGVPMTYVAKALGHSDPATTARHYARVTVSTVAEHLKRVSL
jgi:integrase